MTMSETHTHHSHGDDCAPHDLDHHLAIARAVCARASERFTPLREHVFELIVNAEGPVKAYDLLSQLKPEVGSPKPPTVYRALDFLSNLNLIHRVEALNAYVVCDHVHEGHVAEFFICESCHSLTEDHIEEKRVVPPKGFQVSRSIIEHYGKCADCLAKAA